MPIFMQFRDCRAAAALSERSSAVEQRSIPPRQGRRGDFLQHVVPGPILLALVAPLLFAGETQSMPPDRKPPELLQPMQSRVALVRLQIPSFIFDSEFKQILVLDAVPKPGRKPSVAGARSDQEEYKSHFVDISQITSINDKKLAETVYPVRAAELVAAFPYKAQVEEFRDKLGLGSDEQVLAEQCQEKGKNRRPLPAFRFLGVRLERRRTDADGKPLDARGRRVDAKSGWAEVNLEDSFKPLMILDGRRFEDEDPKLLPVELAPSLVMRKLLTFGDRRVPPVAEYPQLEEEMPDLKATLETIKKSSKAIIVAPALAGEDFFHRRGHAGRDRRLVTRPFSALVHQKAALRERVPQTGPDLDFPGLHPDPSVRHDRRPRQNLRVPDANSNGQSQPRPGRCVFKRGCAQPELPSKDWYVLPEKVAVPLDVNYYAVDQAKLDAAAQRERSASTERTTRTAFAGGR